MSDLIEEIKEDVRLDQLIKFFRKYANHIIGVALVGIIFSAGYAFWQHSKEKQQRVTASAFDEALQLSLEGHSREAMELLTTLEKNASGGYAILAVFRRAMLGSTSSEDKIKLYRDIMENSGIEPKFRELATVLWGYEGIDSEDVTQLQQKLEPVAQSRSPWMNSAQELLALLDIRKGEIKAAAQRLHNLSNDENVISGVRTRAFALLEQLGH
ncbi:MAG: tetratricopeptide repeat protein [Caedimonas sp.]|jgi:hypothetical protein|nr:tetratricopeptide repeat protein [Caedimonas sp.]